MCCRVHQAFNRERHAVGKLEDLLRRALQLADATGKVILILLIADQKLAQLTFDESSAKRGKLRKAEKELQKRLTESRTCKAISACKKTWKAAAVCRRCDNDSESRDEIGLLRADTLRGVSSSSGNTHHFIHL